MAIPTLYIGYAMAFITEKQIEDTFNQVTNESLVDSVDSCEKTNKDTGRPFKLFFIKFKKTNDILDNMILRIKDEGLIKLNYDRDWFWKVQMYIPKIDDSILPPPPPV